MKTVQRLPKRIRNRSTGCGQILRLVVVLVTLAPRFLSIGQTPLTITFEGPPTVSPASGNAELEYVELGMRFRKLGPDDILRVHSGYFADPDNGSTFLVGTTGGHSNVLAFAFMDGSRFAMSSVDLAEYGINKVPALVQFFGFREDNSVVTTAFTTDGINDTIGPLADFQTFYFSTEFSDLTRVEIASWGWSLDNLVIQVPEPSSLALLGGGGLLLWAGVRRRTRTDGQSRG